MARGRELEPEHLIRFPNYHIVLKLMIDGAPSKPFTAETITADAL